MRMSARREKGGYRNRLRRDTSRSKNPAVIRGQDILPYGMTRIARLDQHPARILTASGTPGNLNQQLVKVRSEER